MYVISYSEKKILGIREVIQITSVFLSINDSLQIDVHTIFESRYLVCWQVQSICLYFFLNTYFNSRFGDIHVLFVNYENLYSPKLRSYTKLKFRPLSINQFGFFGLNSV